MHSYMTLADFVTYIRVCWVGKRWRWNNSKFSSLQKIRRRNQHWRYSTNARWAERLSDHSSADIFSRNHRVAESLQARSYLTIHGHRDGAACPITDRETMPLHGVPLDGGRQYSSTYWYNFERKWEGEVYRRAVDSKSQQMGLWWITIATICHWSCLLSHRSSTRLPLAWRNFTDVTSPMGTSVGWVIPLRRKEFISYGNSRWISF